MIEKTLLVERPEGDRTDEVYDCSNCGFCGFCGCDSGTDNLNANANSAQMTNDMTSSMG